MTKFKPLITQVMHYLSRFKKQDKKRGSPKLLKSTRKQVNLLVLAGLGGLALIGIFGSLRAITLSNKVTSLEKSIKDRQSSQVVSTTTDTYYRLTYYLNDYISAYFTFSSKAEEQEEQTKKLNSFYDIVPETKNQGQKRTQSSLVSSKLLTLTEKTATYQVTYKQKNGDRDEEITTGFTVPYGEKGGTYYISGLPWFSSLTNSQATGFDKETALALSASDNLSEKIYDKVEKFLDIFFTNYTTDQDNLDLVGKDLTVLDNTTYKSLDYVYLKEDGNTITSYVQVTFEVAGSTHSENFTLTLSTKNKSYYVTKLTHTIPTNYAKLKGD
ncbi:TPA: conjugal transfer protein [Streptococcus pyogenes]|nr:conjugal transfer protein [Streptococcus pyogenes]